MRIGEIAALYESDIYDDMIYVRRTVRRTSTGNYIIGDDTKTEHSTRSIPINDNIREILEHQKEINRMIDGEEIKSIHETIFKSFQRGILLPFPVGRDIDRICRRAGIERFAFHALRATFATRCIEQGIEPRTLQELLGHADFGLTMNLYGHVVDNTKTKAMNKIRIAL